MLYVSVQRALMEQAVGRSARQVAHLIAQVAPEAMAPRDRVRPLGNGRWELKAAIDAECQRRLEKLKELSSYTDSSMTYGKLIARLVRDGFDRHDPGRRGAGRRGSAPEAVGGPAAHATRQAEANAKHIAAHPPAPELESDAVPASTPETRAIRAATKREVWRRDGGRTYIDRRAGRRCDSYHLLQIDHIEPYAIGGTADPENLRLLCASHYRHHHEDFIHQTPPPRWITPQTSSAHDLGAHPPASVELTVKTAG